MVNIRRALITSVIILNFFQFPLFAQEHDPAYSQADRQEVIDYLSTLNTFLTDPRLQENKEAYEDALSRNRRGEISQMTSNRVTIRTQLIRQIDTLPAPEDCLALKELTIEYQKAMIDAANADIDLSKDRISNQEYTEATERRPAEISSKISEERQRIMKHYGIDQQSIS